MWDLHVHTPASIVHHYGDGNQQSVWDAFFADLAALPPSIKAIAITDYWSIEGYRRVLDAKERDLLPNLQLVLPAIELRIARYAGSSLLRKLNYHVLFSNELSPDEIESCFLRKLTLELQLAKEFDWSGDVGSRGQLEELGRAVIAFTPLENRTDESPLSVGFNNAAVDLDVVSECLKQSRFRDRTLTALGRGEWSEMRWEGGGAAHKRDAIERVDFLLTASASAEEYQAQLKKLVAAKVNSRLIHASDAHYFSSSSEPNRLGATLA